MEDTWVEGTLGYLSVALTWALTRSTQTCFFTISIKGQSTHSCRSNPTGCHSLKKRVVFEELWESTPWKQGVSPRIPGVQRGLRGGVVSGDEVNRKSHPPVNLETPLDPKYIASARCNKGQPRASHNHSTIFFRCVEQAQPTAFEFKTYTFRAFNCAMLTFLYSA